MDHTLVSSFCRRRWSNGLTVVRVVEVSPLGGKKEPFSPTFYEIPQTIEDCAVIVFLYALNETIKHRRLWRVRTGVGLHELARCVIAPTVAPIIHEIVSCRSGLTPDSIVFLPDLIERIVLIALTEWSARRAAVGVVNEVARLWSSYGALVGVRKASLIIVHFPVLNDLNLARKSR